MRLERIILLTLNFFCLSICAQGFYNEDMEEKELQILRCLQHSGVDYNAEYEAWQFGLPDPEPLTLKNQYGNEVQALELCPPMPIGVIICISGVDAPSVTAYYGHAMEFYKMGYVTILMDVRSHIKINDKRYEEVKDVQAVSDYIKSKLEYINLPVIAMGVAMGGTVAMRSMIESYDINAVMLLSAYSSFEDYFALNRHEAEPIYDMPNVSPGDIAMMSEADSITMSKICNVSGINRRPVLLMQSKGDKFVPYAYFQQFVRKARRFTTELDTYVLEGNEHYICRDFLNPAADKEYFKAVKNFLKRLEFHIPTLASRKLEDTCAI